VFGNAVSSDQKYGSDDEIECDGDPEDEYESQGSGQWGGEEESLEASMGDEEDEVSPALVLGGEGRWSPVDRTVMGKVVGPLRFLVQQHLGSCSVLSGCIVNQSVTLGATRRTL
jgi:hypothetical protein